MEARGSTLERVTVYQEGARVERSMRMAEPAREARFEGLPLCLDDGSLRVEVKGGGVALDTRVTVDVPREDPTLGPAVDEALEAARREGEAARGEVARLRRARERLAALEIGARPALRPGEAALPIPLESRERLVEIRAAEDARLAEALVEANARAKEAERKRAEAEDRATRATTARNAREHELRKVVVVVLEGLEPGAVVTIGYEVPFACWSPSYVIVLTAEGARLGMRALVAQRSGEDWQGVRLRLSTARPGAWVELPELARARIGRAQPEPRKSGFREPPEGARALYADYDRVAGELEPPEPLAADETTSPGFAVAKVEALPPPPPPPAAAPMPLGAQPAYAPPAFEMARSAPKKGGFSFGSRSRELPLPAPQARSSAGQSLALEEDTGDLAEARLAPAPELAVSADALAFGRLRMRGPASFERGELVAVSAASAYVEALGVTVRVDVAALVHVAIDRARVDASQLPTGYELARTTDAFDYAYDAAAPCDVPADGGFHAVLVAEWDAATAMRYVAVPRESQQVFRMVDLTSPIDGALLAGPIDVYEGTAADSTYRMTTHMPPTPPKGKVELGLGVEPAVKLARTTTFQEDSAGLLGSSLALGHSVSVELRNLLGRRVVVEVRERVPVIRKDDTEVKVEASAEPPWETWDQEQSLRGGHLWKIELEPGAARTLHARYTIKIAAKQELVGGNRREA